MGLVSPDQTPANGLITSSGINTPINQLAAVINGGIDSANITDSGITTVDLADGAVSPAKLSGGAGGSWVWQTWTPTWVNLSTGNGTVTASYTQVGKTVHFQIRFVLGSTSAVGTFPTFTLPVTAATRYSNLYIVGQGKADDVGVSSYPLIVSTTNATTGQAEVIGAAGTYANLTGITASIPFSWATGDVFLVNGTYEAA